MSQIIKSNTIRVTTEIFSIPYKGNYIIYAPLKQLAILVTPTIANLLYEITINNHRMAKTDVEESIINYFMKLDILNGSTVNTIIQPKVRDSLSYVTLLLTNRCNMRCIYCYASGGERDQNTIPIEIAKAAIDIVIKASLKSNQKSIGIGFHGGGEPTLAWKTLKACVEYVKENAIKNGLKFELSMATNGIMSKRKLDWIMENFTHLSLSFDGLEEIQNYQRPLADGDESFKKVLETIKRMNDKIFSYGVRVTITPKSVKKMSRIVEFIGNNCRIKKIHFEPTFACGRCLSTGINSPSAEDFIKGYRRAQKVAERFGIQIFYSGARLYALTTSFCKASGKSFCVTPKGFITSCYEVCSEDDIRSEVFFYGKWDIEQKQFIFFKERLEHLMKLTVNNVTFCEDCFCKYHCAGDCLAKTFMGENQIYESNRTRCQINQILTLDQILKILKKEKNYYLHHDTYQN